MNWARFALVVLLSGVIAMFADWLFAGVLFHDKYLAYPEVWRGAPGQPETRRIILSTALGFVTCAVFAFVAVRLSLPRYSLATLKLAFAVWVMVAVPMQVTNSLWMKIHPAIAVSHSLSWLAKLIAAALVVSWLRP